MGYTKTTVSFSLFLIATFRLLSTATATANANATATAVSPFCTTAENKLLVLCTKMVKGAKTWEQAMTNAINFAMVKGKAGKAIADGIIPKLPETLYPQTKESILINCNGAYERIVFNLEKALRYMKSDPSSLKSCFSSTSFWECTFTLEEFEISFPEVNRYDKEITQRVTVLLSVLETRPGNTMD